MHRLFGLNLAYDNYYVIFVYALRFKANDKLGTNQVNTNCEGNKEPITPADTRQVVPILERFVRESDSVRSVAITNFKYPADFFYQFRFDIFPCQAHCRYSVAECKEALADASQSVRGAKDGD